MGFARLTALGACQMYERGVRLRKRYVEALGLLGPRYRRDELYVRAGNSDRALQTAQMLMRGLYPSGTGADPSIHDRRAQRFRAPIRPSRPCRDRDGPRIHC